MMRGGGAPVKNVGQFVSGDIVKLTRSEMLTFKGEDFRGAAKGQEFIVLKSEPRNGVVYVGFYKDDGSLIAVALPAASLEPLPANGWSNLLRGAESFKEQRYDDARRFLAKAVEDAQYRAVATTLLARINAAVAAAAPAAVDPSRAAAARRTCIAAIQGLRDAAEQLVQQGSVTLAFQLEEGTDRLGNRALGKSEVLPTSKTNRADLSTQAATADRALGWYRQAVGLHRLMEASRAVEEGLKAEPGRPELKSAEPLLQKLITEADVHHQNADKMRQHGPKGVVHALTALEMGLKICADHPKLLALKKEMQSSFEERTAPPITEAFLKAARAEASAKALDEGRRLYTSRCTECHDLELLDSRSVGAWRDIVGSMARRAKIDGPQQSRIVDYLAAAQRGLDVGS